MILCCFLRLRRDMHGVTAIEFALIAPLLIILTMGIIEFSLIMLSSAIIENASSAAARIGMTGNVYDKATREEKIISEILANSNGLLSSNNLNVNISRFSNYVSLSNQSTSQIDLTGTSGDFGVGNEPLLYEIEYEWKLITPLAFLINMPFSEDDPHVVKLRSSVLVKNERFS
jgi:Flp pilus assembly protein TadG